MSPGVQDQLEEHRETPSLQKIRKLARCDGAHLWFQPSGRLKWADDLAQEVEAAGNRDCATALQPGQQSGTSALKKLKKRPGVVARTCSPSTFGG